MLRARFVLGAVIKSTIESTPAPPAASPFGSQLPPSPPTHPSRLLTPGMRQNAYNQMAKTACRWNRRLTEMESSASVRGDLHLFMMIFFNF